jgi:hypothetical protein
MKPTYCYGIDPQGKFCGQIALHFENKKYSSTCMISDEVCTYSMKESTTHFGKPLKEPLTIKCNTNKSGADFTYISPDT